MWGTTHFHTPFARALNHLLALCRRSVLPSLAQHLPPFGGQLLEPAEVLSDRTLLIRRQRLKSLPAIAKHATLIGRQRAPTLETLLGLSTLLGRHAKPAITPPRQCLLALRRQRIPIAAELAQQLLLLT
jgi:hypothetical protein